MTGDAKFFCVSHFHRPVKTTPEQNTKGYAAKDKRDS
jgi:hypothetical protein